MRRTEKRNAGYATQRNHFITEEILQGAHEGCRVGGSGDSVGCGERWKGGFGRPRMSVGHDLRPEFGKDTEPIVCIHCSAWSQEFISTNGELFLALVAHEDVAGFFSCRTQCLKTVVMIIAVGGWDVLYGIYLV